jgi:hypothetical protein
MLSLKIDKIRCLVVVSELHAVDKRPEKIA